MVNSHLSTTTIYHCHITVTLGFRLALTALSTASPPAGLLLSVDIVVDGQHRLDLSHRRHCCRPMIVDIVVNASVHAGRSFVVDS